MRVLTKSIHMENGKRMLFVTTIIFLAVICNIYPADSAFGDCTISQTAHTAWTSNGTKDGQSFTATCTGNLTSILIYPQTTGASTLTIYSGQSVAGGDQLYTQAVNLTANQDNTLTLSTPVSLTSGQQYTFTLTGSKIWYSDGSVYAGGQLYDQVAGPGFVVGACCDAYFTAIITATTTTTAAPTTNAPLMTDVGSIIFALLAGLGGIYTIIRAKVK
ncbi:MAG: hypothetical protein HQK99_03610 [Nitrospirae bacterium]|nr:hypothetical protein [Nitrospirota bacterium]